MKDKDEDVTGVFASLKAGDHEAAIVALVEMVVGLAVEVEELRGARGPWADSQRFAERRARRQALGGE